MKEEKNILMKNNELIKARYDLTVVQSRIFIFMLYKLQKDKNGEMSCFISKEEFGKLIARRNEKTIKGITEILRELSKRRIYFKEYNSNNECSCWGEYTFISGFEYHAKINSFKIICSHRVYDLLTNYLEIGYTPINLSIYLSLKNSNAQRLYDLLRLWSNSKHTIRYSVEELKELLMIEDKYKNYSDLKRSVLSSAVKSLNNTGAFEIEMSEKKKGKKVEYIDFHVKDLDDRIYFSSNDKLESNVSNEQLNFNSPVPGFCIPDEGLLSKGVRIRFKRDFRDIDFSYEAYEDAFFDAVARTFDKDNVDIIDNKSYNYFRTTLKERLGTYLKRDVELIL